MVTEVLKNCHLCGRPLLAGVAGQVYCNACMLKSVLTDKFEDELSQEWDVPTLEEMAILFPELTDFSFIAIGGMGAVFKARQVALNRWIAIKILPPEHGGQKLLVDYFQNEAKNLALLNHPGIVTIHDFGIRSEFYYFVMEFVEGKNLEQILNERVILSLEEAVDILLQLCDSLDYTHRVGILHCDLKPGNVICMADGRVKLMDFGISRLLSDDVSTEVMAGTKGFTAPELITRQQSPTIQSDIYSLGVLFFYMLTGKLPSSVHQCYLPICVSEKLPPAIPAVLTRMLSMNTKRRYRSVGKLSEALRQAMNYRQPIRNLFYWASGFAIAFLIGLTTILLNLEPKHFENSVQTEDVAESKHEVAEPIKFVLRNVQLPGGIAIALRPIPAGTFLMGSTDVLGYLWEAPIRRVVISNSFWMSECEITQSQYLTVMGENPSEVNGYDLPVTNVSHADAMAYCTQLNRIENLAGNLPDGYEFRLPTEAEWEYVAKGGDQNPDRQFAGTGTIDELVWTWQNSKKIQPIARKRANRLGIFDLNGNVAEWCLDYFCSSGYPQQKMVVNPYVDEDCGEGHTIRGGHVFMTNLDDYRNSARSGGSADKGVGFRIVLAPKIEKKEGR